MRTVLTLIAGSKGRSVLPDAAAAISGMLGPGTAPVWLAPGEACDLFLGALDTNTIEGEARASLGDAAIDLVLQPAVARRKLLLVADLESTMIENELLDELAELSGVGPSVAAITRAAMNGEIDFDAALAARVALFEGMDQRLLDVAAARIRPSLGARPLVATMRRHGAVTALVSGGFAVFARPVATALGFDHVVANLLDLVDGKFAGTIRAPIVTGETKRMTLLALAARYRIADEATLAVGDGANDLPMLAAAGLGIAYRPKPAVKSAVRWRLDHADLLGLLYVQGYCKEEIALDFI